MFKFRLKKIIEIVSFLQEEKYQTAKTISKKNWKEVKIMFENVKTSKFCHFFGLLAYNSKNIKIFLFLILAFDRG